MQQDKSKKSKTIYDIETGNPIIKVWFSPEHPARKLVEDAQKKAKEREDFIKFNNLK